MRDLSSPSNESAIIRLASQYLNSNPPVVQTEVHVCSAGVRQVFHVRSTEPRQGFVGREPKAVLHVCSMSGDEPRLGLQNMTILTEIDRSQAQIYNHGGPWMRADKRFISLADLLTLQKR